MNVDYQRLKLKLVMSKNLDSYYWAGLYTLLNVLVVKQCSMCVSGVMKTAFNQWQLLFFSSMSWTEPIIWNIF